MLHSSPVSLQPVYGMDNAKEHGMNDVNSRFANGQFAFIYTSMDNASTRRDLQTNNA